MNIIEPTNTFDFSNITLSHPINSQGGAYFTKIENNKQPLYIQTPKSITKQGIVKTGKRYHCDIMFDKSNETIINWLENLEETCHKLIYNKKQDWFQGSLEESDIETAFNPLLRVYKSGKYYLLRTNIKTSKDDVPVIKIYNEQETPLGITDITSETEIITILDIQGIKFTTRNFQIELEMKQIMVFNNQIFDGCLIKPLKNANNLEENNVIVNERSNTLGICDDTNYDVQFKNINCDVDYNNNDIFNDTVNTVNNDGSNLIDNISNEKNVPIDTNNLEIVFEDLTEPDDSNLDLREVDNADLQIDTEHIVTLKKPNEVYYELYKEARQKAKEAKKSAIIAYLEAKHIKKTYMIDSIDDSDFEAEIDETTDSDLEEFN